MSTDDYVHFIFDDVNENKKNALKCVLIKVHYFKEGAEPLRGEIMNKTESRYNDNELRNKSLLEISKVIVPIIFQVYTEEYKK